MSKPTTQSASIWEVCLYKNIHSSCDYSAKANDVVVWEDVIAAVETFMVTPKDIAFTTIVDGPWAVFRLTSRV